MKIEVSELTREDGVKMFRDHEDHDRWLVRDIKGHSWFWHMTENRWVSGIKFSEYKEHLYTDFTGAYKLLQTLEKFRYTKEILNRD